MLPEQVLNSRRQFLAIAAASGVATLGCKPAPKEAETTVPSTSRRDVPLRVLLCGTDAWSAAISTAWSGIAEQPLQINVLDPAKINADDWEASVLKALPQSDVAIVPSGLVPAIEAASGLTPPSDDLLGADGIDSSSFFAMLREGLMKFGGRSVGVPLGAAQPALAMKLSAFEGQSVSPPKDWKAFIDLASRLNAESADASTDPVVAEPLAAGAAAKMFLWRASAAEPEVWLFERDSFLPVIDSQPYVDVLETMKQCADQYRGARLTEGEVWSRLASGQLKMAIGWPAVSPNAARIEEVTEYEFSPLPRTANADESALQSVAPMSTLLDFDSPVAILSSHCRQSDAAKRFLKWIIGGEGTSMIKSAVTGLTEVRASGSATSFEADEVATGSESSGDARTGVYSAVLSQNLSTLRIRTPLQLLQYRRYAKALDDAVLACLDGKQTAGEALAAAAEKWKALTTELGLKPQTQAWRKAQGLRS
jgi:ABC-type glycerol-3-phosphate transport system substrate-binding protein